MEDDDTAWEFHEYSGEDQTRLVDAYFEAVNQRPWIVGMFEFGYPFWDLPLLGGSEIRAKPAEDVWRKWNDMKDGGTLTYYCPNLVQLMGSTLRVGVSFLT